MTGEPIVGGRNSWGKKAATTLSGLAARPPGGAKSLTSAPSLCRPSSAP